MIYVPVVIVVVTAVVTVVAVVVVAIVSIVGIVAVVVVVVVVGCGVGVVVVVVLVVVVGLVVSVVDGGFVVVGGSIGVDKDLPVYKCPVHYIFWTLGFGYEVTNLPSFMFNVFL